MICTQAIENVLTFMPVRVYVYARVRWSTLRMLKCRCEQVYQRREHTYKGMIDLVNGASENVTARAS